MGEDRADVAKQAMRARLMRERRALVEAERRRVDDLVATAVRHLPEFVSADLVLSYLSLGSEVETRGIIRTAWAAGKTVALPRCVDGPCDAEDSRDMAGPRDMVGPRDMEWFRVDSLDGLVMGEHGIEEPPRDPSRLVGETAISASTIAIVPGLAFDAAGFRLGYGGGYYDVFLSTFPGTSVGLCREGSLRANLTRDGAVGRHDVPVDIVVTEGRVLRPRS
ncbi:MAG: 5-formyltetrahydrofolate cyclo-ligase [Atopobiaceae bacterium]|jgi:5-formyltetrahydrofolate cyclo-ligase|nr:5-formyltetrahydrofolate cyclo-ligase [Atopobiaceae bacterium]MCI2172898.1 5-formyltetrahydrofolate cyclo-ligase [Atopobiaceae bacterium]MCI2208303.1 5-formyltetrahydrofolate cyclo-ligase [Atopobiaceae bacterium]